MQTCNWILQIELPPLALMAYLVDMYGFDALPRAKSAEIEQVCQIPWQPPPV